MKYKDRVKVIGGFYEGQEGTVVDERESDIYNNCKRYNIIISGRNSIYTGGIEEKDLELIK